MGTTKYEGFEVTEWPESEMPWATWCVYGPGYCWSIEPGYKSGIALEISDGNEGSMHFQIPTQAFVIVAEMIAKYPRKE